MKRKLVLALYVGFTGFLGLASIVLAANLLLS